MQHLDSRTPTSSNPLSSRQTPRKSRSAPCCCNVITLQSSAQSRSSHKIYSRRSDTILPSNKKVSQLSVRLSIFEYIYSAASLVCVLIIVRSPNCSRRSRKPLPAFLAGSRCWWSTRLSSSTFADPRTVSPMSSRVSIKWLSTTRCLLISRKVSRLLPAQLRKLIVWKLG